jgi:hypothetical protein
MLRAIDRKYEIQADSNGIAITKLNRSATAIEIPRDEPLILFRARDALAVPMLTHYARLCTEAGCDPGQLELLHKRIGDFLAWQKNHAKEMHLPASESQDNYEAG